MILSGLASPARTDVRRQVDVRCVNLHAAGICRSGATQRCWHCFQPVWNVCLGTPAKPAYPEVSARMWW